MTDQPTDDRQARRRGIEQAPALDDEDDAILDKIWDRIGKERAEEGIRAKPDERS
ncbi:MAG: hypothetical protein ACLQGP_26205 [Isosphaeraceae bacterium]